jgi:Tol biopolymer transport system component
MALPTGTRFGPYEITGALGAGGMGEVYRARDPRLHRDVALKVLHPGPHADAARLLREARVVATFGADPHVVTVYDVGESDGLGWVAMELVDGLPLSRRIVPGGLPLDDVLRLAADIAAGLARAHGAGIVHRDLKPANVMVTRDGTAKLLDFGLATRAEGPSGDTSTFAGLTGPGVVAGTVGYMSPEQAEGRPVDPRSDVFAFGLVLYEMATGRRAFERDSGMATLAAILRDPAPSLAASRPDAPRDLVRIVERCLRKAPERRVQSMADLRVALDDLRDDLAAPAPVEPPRVAPIRGGWTRAAWAAGLLVAGALGAGAAAWWRPAAAPPLVGTALTQLTFDAGIANNPSLSPDGSLLAFASDRAGGGNLDVWVQPVGGGEPVQVTREPTDERTPVFSPDGGRIFFRSERDGGGIYSVPALGGEPRLVVAGGLSPRLSPDGRQLAYWTGSFIGFAQAPGAYRTFVVDATGGTPREITGFTNIRFPVWAPDGRSLIASATRAESPTAETYDWWIVALDGGPATATGTGALLGQAASDVGAQGAPSAWTGDRVLTSWRGDLWAVVLTGAGRTAAGVERLTFGPGAEAEPAATGDGLVAFADVSSRLSVWSLPIDTDQARLQGEFRRVTSGTGPYWRATVSADERWAAFFGPGRPPPTIQVQDLSTGRLRDLGSAPGASFGPVISPDGRRVAYSIDSGGLHVAEVNGGAPTTLCRDCQEAGDWTRDGQRLMVVTKAGPQTGLGLADPRTGEVTAVAAALPDRSLNRPSLSPDNRWIAFRAIGAGAQSVYVAPFQPPHAIPAEAWVPLGEPERDLRPVGWSPSGRLLYLFSARDGFRCLYVQRIDPVSGQPQGEATLVKHMHNVRAPGGGGGSVVSTGAANVVGRQQILFDFPDQTVNVWRMQLAPPTTPAAGSSAARPGPLASGTPGRAPA